MMQLKTNLNLKVTIHPLARGTFIEKRAKGEFGMMLYPWPAVFTDPSNFLYDLFYSKSSLNSFKYSNSLVDNLLLKAGEVNDIHLRENLYHQAEDIILEDVPIIPLCFPKRFILVNKRVRGIEYNPLEIRPFTKISLD